MAHKTFISYKYSDLSAREFRDKIIDKMGADAQFYRGENGYSSDLSSYTASTIKNHLSSMIFDTSVMIVIISPNAIYSQWMEWEIQYALREQSRNGRTSHANGVICVVLKDKDIIARNLIWGTNYDAYQWAKDYFGNWSPYKFFDIIKNNHNNKKSWAIYDRNYAHLSNSYIDIITEDQFIRHFNEYIEATYQKSQYSDCYNITKQ